MGSKFIAIGINEELHTDFKEWCARNRTTMKESIVELVEERIKTDIKEDK